MKFKIWFLELCVKLCNKCLKNSDLADDQNEVNDVVATKNYFLKELRKLKQQ